MKQNNISFEHTSRMSILFSLLLLFVFILSTVFLILIGSQVYQNIRQQNTTSFYSNTASNYIANKIRQLDTRDAVQIRKEDGQEILVITSEEDNTKFETWIYAKDNSLMELYTPANSGLTVNDGIAILPCESLSFSLDSKKHLLTITLKQQKNAPSYSINLLLRTNS